MSKNLTRKGLAFGALVALGTSVIAGTPAFATTLTTTPSAGTSYKVLLGTKFDLNTVIGGFVSGDNLKYQITGLIATDFSDSNGQTAGTTIEERAVTDLAAADSSTTAYNDTALTTVTSLDATGKTVVLDAHQAAGSYSQALIGLNTTTVTATTSIVVTPFLDNNTNNDEITGEVTGSPVTITFVKPSEVTATTTIDPVVTGVSSTLKAKVTLSGDINLAQIVSGNNGIVKVEFKDNGSSLTSSTPVEANWVKADAALVATLATQTIAANHVATAQAQISGVASGTAAISSGDVSASTVTSVADPASTLSSSIKVTSSTAYVYSVRTGTTSVPVSAKVLVTNADSDTGQAAPAGVPVRVTIAENGANLASTITAGGKTLSSASVSDTAESISFDTTTNADGKALFTITSSAGTLADTISVSVKALGTSAWIPASHSATYTWADATISTDVVRLNSNGQSSVIGVKKGGSYSVSYLVTDNFGAPIADSTTASKKRAVRITGSGLAGVAIDQTVAVSNGVATFTVADTATATGTYNLVARLQQRNAGDTAWENATSSANNTTAVYVQTDPTVGYVSADKSGTPTLSYSDFVTGELNLISNQNTAFALPVTGGVGGSGQTGKVTVSGTVLATDGTAAAGVAVVISGTGLEFATYSEGVANKVLAAGTITVYTTSTGGYSVDVYSHKAGKVAISVKAGSITKTVTPEWAAAAENTATVIAITAPSNALPGSTQAITVALTDELGNAVDTDQVDQTTGYNQTFSITVTGAGISGTIPTATDGDGLAKFYQLIGSADSGTFKVTVSYDRDGASHTYAAITKSATVTIGAAPVVAPTAAKANVVGKTKAFSVSVSGNASAKNVVVKVAGKTVATLKGSASAKTYTVKATKGSKKVTVYVGGKLLLTKTVSVK